MTSEENSGIILVVEDEDIARRNLTHILVKEGYEVHSTRSGVEAIPLLNSRTFDLIITDLKMEKMDGMELLHRAKSLQPHTEVIMITGYATVDTAVAAMQKGAYFYIAKPYKLEEVKNITREALLKRKLFLENLELKASLKKLQGEPAIIGRSSAMRSVLETVAQIAPSDINVLITGESGTGKELVAKAIHDASPRADKRFVAFNCGSFTEELMANELFGHEKEAYTGATRQRPGLIETAGRGTLFLDEVGDMPLSMQVKLLRVIQEKEILRVGGVQPVSVDVRFISATHRDLSEDIEEGRFRQDLFYRLNVIGIQLPPLAERKGDILLLAHHFLAKKSREMHKSIREIEKEAVELLNRYSWPGNVRELENVIERAVALENGEAITAEDLPDDIRNVSIETYRHHSGEIPTLIEQEKRYIQWVLERTGWNKTQAAKIMDIDRVSLWRKMKRYELE